jgi:hypothetical protein
VCDATRRREEKTGLASPGNERGQGRRSHVVMAVRTVGAGGETVRDHGRGGGLWAVVTQCLAGTGDRARLPWALAGGPWPTKTRRPALIKWVGPISTKKILFQLFQTTSCLQNMKVVPPALQNFANFTRV